MREQAKFHLSRDTSPTPLGVKEREVGETRERIPTPNCRSGRGERDQREIKTGDKCGLSFLNFSARAFTAVTGYETEPLSSEYGAYKTVRAGL